MTLIATMLAGPCAAAPTRAVASVLDWVDQLLVLDSGLSAEHLATLQAQAGPKFRHTRFAWPQDFATARNLALDQATHLGGHWAVTIDTDEQLHLPGYANQAELLAALEPGRKCRRGMCRGWEASMRRTASSGCRRTCAGVPACMNT